MHYRYRYMYMYARRILISVVALFHLLENDVTLTLANSIRISGDTTTTSKFRQDGSRLESSCR